MGIDDESSHPELCSEVAGGVTPTIVCLFREPDAGNPPVRFDEREQEPELRQTGLRRVMRKHPNSHREAKATAPVLDSTRLNFFNNPDSSPKRLAIREGAADLIERTTDQGADAVVVAANHANPSYEPRWVGIDNSCCSVKSRRVSLVTFTWSPFVMTSDPAPSPP